MPVLRVTEIDISGVDKAQVLIALYLHAKVSPVANKPLSGLSWLIDKVFQNDTLTLDKARKLIASGQRYFYEVYGRSLHIDLSRDTIDTWNYDTINGYNAAKDALKHLL